MAFPHIPSTMGISFGDGIWPTFSSGVWVAAQIIWQLVAGSTIPKNNNHWHPISECFIGGVAFPQIVTALRKRGDITNIIDLDKLSSFSPETRLSWMNHIVCIYISMYGHMLCNTYPMYILRISYLSIYRSIYLSIHPSIYPSWIKCDKSPTWDSYSYIHHDSSDVEIWGHDEIYLDGWAVRRTWSSVASNSPDNHIDSI